MTNTQEKNYITHDNEVLEIEIDYDNMSYEEICDFIRRKRKKLGLTQKEFVAKYSVGLRTLNKIENYEPVKDDTLKTLLSELGQDLNTRIVYSLKPKKK